MPEQLDYYRQRGFPDEVINFDARERKAAQAAARQQIVAELDLFMGHVGKERAVAVGLGLSLGGLVGGVISLISEPSSTNRFIEVVGAGVISFGCARALLRNRTRVMDKLYDWSANWNDSRRTRERAAEIAANSWEFDGQQMWLEGTRTDKRGMPETVLGTPTGEIITHSIQHVRRPP